MRKLGLLWLFAQAGRNSGSRRSSAAAPPAKHFENFNGFFFAFNGGEERALSFEIGANMLAYTARDENAAAEIFGQAFNARG